MPEEWTSEKILHIARDMGLPEALQDMIDFSMVMRPPDPVHARIQLLKYLDMLEASEEVGDVLAKQLHVRIGFSSQEERLIRKQNYEVVPGIRR